MEGALHGNLYIFPMYGFGYGFVGLWVYGLQEWADSALFTISICILLGCTILSDFNSAFGLEFLLQLDEAPA
jgi:hypothetical protein